MLKQFAVLLFILFFALNGFSRPKNPFLNDDSLKNSLSYYLAKSSEYLYTLTDSANFYAERAKMVANSLGDSANYYTAIKQLGRSEYIMGHYDLSLVHYVQAETYYERQKNKAQISEALINIGLVHAAIENQDIAFTYYFQAEKQLLKIEEYKSLPRLYFNIGISFKDLGNSLSNTQLIDSSLYWFNKSLDLIKKYPNHIIELRNYSMMGETFFFLKNYKQADTYFNKALNLLAENDDWDRGFILGGLAGNYLEMGNYTKAIETGNKAIKIQSRLNAKWELLRIKKYVYQAYERKGDLKNAFKELKDYSELNFDVFNAERQADIVKMELSKRELQQAKLEKITIEQEADLNDQQFVITALVVILTFLIIGFIYLRKTTRVIEHLNNQLSAKNDQLNTMISLKNEVLAILGHDMTNMLGSTEGFLQLAKSKEIAKEDFDVIAPVLYQTIDRIHLTFNNVFRWAQLEYGMPQNVESSTNLSSIYNELAFIFEPKLKTKNITLIKDCDKNIKVPISEDNLQLILRNLIHNASKFTPENGEIIVYCKQDNSKIRVGVKDSGVGIDPDRLVQLSTSNKRFTTVGIHDENGTGLGLLATKKILHSFGLQLNIESQLGKGSDFYFEFKFSI